MRRRLLCKPFPAPDPARLPPSSLFVTRTASFKGMDGKILEGISPPIASACCYRPERIVEGNRRWKIAVCLGQESALRSTSRRAACSCRSWHKHQSFSQRTLFHCGKNQFLFFPPSLFSAPPPSRAWVLVQQVTRWSPEPLCLKLSMCLKILPCQELLQEQLFRPGCQGCWCCQPARRHCQREKVWFCFHLNQCKARPAPLPPACDC